MHPRRSRTIAFYKVSIPRLLSTEVVISIHNRSWTPLGACVRRHLPSRLRLVVSRLGPRCAGATAQPRRRFPVCRVLGRLSTYSDPAQGGVSTQHEPW